MSFTVVLDGDWSKQKMTAKKLMNHMPQRIEVFLRREAEVMRALVIVAYDAQGIPHRWKKLSPWTIAGRRLHGFRGTKALVWTGEMRKSISTAWDSASQSAFCGIQYQTKSADGKSMVNIAKLHEYGSKRIAIKITPRMRRYLAVLAKFLPRSARMKKKDRKRHIATGIIVIQIPARPFMRTQLPVFRLNAPVRARKFFMEWIFKA